MKPISKLRLFLFWTGSTVLCVGVFLIRRGQRPGGLTEADAYWSILLVAIAVAAITVGARKGLRQRRAAEEAEASRSQK